MNNRCNRRLVSVLAASLCAFGAIAMPTDQEMKAVRPFVNELMAPFVSEYTAKRLSAAEVGAKARELATRAKSEAATLVLLNGALHYYSV